MSVVSSSPPGMGAMAFGVASLDLRSVRGIVDALQQPGNRRDRLQLELNTVCAIVNACRITTANDAALALMGVREKMLPGAVAAIFTGAHQRTFVEALIALLLDGESLSFEGQLPAGPHRKLDVVFSLWRAPGDVFPEAAWLGMTDVSRRMNAIDARDALQGEIAHAARIAMLGEMTVSIAHEINQPLAAIITSAEAGLRWLSHETPQLDEARALFGRIGESGKRAADIIVAMRSLAANKEPDRKPVALNALIEEAVLLLRPELARRQVAIELNLAEPTSEVAVNRTQILQVIVNLALNAAQAMADGHAWNRTLLIRTRPEPGSAVAVEVEDSGPGVDPKVREKLFESFYTTKTNGVGMGLAICRSMVKSHGSRIELQSSPHLGARFSFTLAALAATAGEQA